MRRATASPDHPMARVVPPQPIAARLWESALSIEGTPAERYIQRKCGSASLLHSAVRFLPHAPFRPYWKSGGGEMPALLAAITDASGAHIGTHLTYLPRKGAISRKYVGEIVGGRIALGEPAKTIVVADTIEAALSGGVNYGLPAFATLTPGNMSKFTPPRGVRQLLIVECENERAHRAVNKLRENLRSARVRVDLVTSEQTRAKRP